MPGTLLIGARHFADRCQALLGIFKTGSPKLQLKGLFHATSAARANDFGLCAWRWSQRSSGSVPGTFGDLQDREPEAPAEGIVPRHKCGPGKRFRALRVALVSKIKRVGARHFWGFFTGRRAEDQLPGMRWWSGEIPSVGASVSRFAPGRCQALLRVGARHFWAVSSRFGQYIGAVGSVLWCCKLGFSVRLLGSCNAEE